MSRCLGVDGRGGGCTSLSGCETVNHSGGTQDVLDIEVTLLQGLGSSFELSELLSVLTVHQLQELDRMTMHLQECTFNVQYIGGA
jgi:hypothetical protein